MPTLWGVVDIPDPSPRDCRAVFDVLARSEARLREAERMVGIGSFELDLVSRDITSSDGFRRLLGVPVDERLGLAEYMQRVHVEDRALVDRAVWDTVESRGSASVEYRIVQPAGVVRTLSVRGEIVCGDDGEPLFLRGAALDVTEQREAERARMEGEALFRRAFDDAPIGMAVVDPLHGGFVRVNDAMCRLVGRPRETLLGLSVEDVTHPDDRGGIAAAQRAFLNDGASYYQGEKRYVRPDGTIVWVSLHSTPMRVADRSTRLVAQIIDVTDRKEHEAELERRGADVLWLRRVRDALDHDRLVLYSQPIIDLTTGRVVQQELLLRMRDEDGAIIAPAHFLPVAERYGLISEIDRWVIHRAATLAAAGVHTQFNLSGKSICDPDILAEIETALAQTGADPSLLVIEVTETAMMERVERGRVFAEGLTALGCALALDDFGTGFAGLTYLKQLPADHLKIDMEFVQDVRRGEAGERMVRAIVGLANEFDLITTAEGVEDEPTL
ncbi:MAG: domain S-box protein, partial [Conexibacter sp.]|nr:domain S-box protein [Conexibacter sp.]